MKRSKQYRKLLALYNLSNGEQYILDKQLKRSVEERKYNALLELCLNDYYTKYGIPYRGMDYSDIFEKYEV